MGSLNSLLQIVSPCVTSPCMPHSGEGSCSRGLLNSRHRVHSPGSLQNNAENDSSLDGCAFMSALHPPHLLYELLAWLWPSLSETPTSKCESRSSRTRRLVSGRLEWDVVGGPRCSSRVEMRRVDAALFIPWYCRSSALSAKLKQLTNAFVTQQLAALPARPTLRSRLPLTSCGLTSQADCIQSCKALLDTALSVPYTSDVTQGIFSVELRGAGTSREPPNAPTPATKHAYVFGAGYGSGLGLWALNLQEFAAQPDTDRVIAFDWLGTGASNRPEFTAKTVREGEDFFVESFEAWRREKGLDRVTFVGHSLGGYLSAAYALAYPQHVSHLVLVSPAAIPTAPDAVDVVRRERRHWAVPLLEWAWQANVTPQGIVRALGSRGRNWASNVLGRRFAHVFNSGAPLGQEELLAYLWNITTAAGSGEFALSVLLSFGAHAREAMGPRLTAAALPLPVTFLYGHPHDWMPASAGVEVCERLQRDGRDARTILLPDSSHHLYLDQPGLFNHAVIGRVREAAARTSGSRELR